MKLIIDIPNRAYVMTKEMKRVIDADNEEVVAEAIIKGISLDAIKDKINQESDYYDENINTDIAYGLRMAAELIDKHTGKGKE